MQVQLTLNIQLLKKKEILFQSVTNPYCQQEGQTKRKAGQFCATFSSKYFPVIMWYGVGILNQAKMVAMMEKAASSVEDCKKILVNMQHQLDRIEKAQGGETDNIGKNTSTPSSIKKFGENSEGNDSSDKEEYEMETKEEQNDNDSSSDDEEEEECGGMRKLAMVSMAGGAILIGGALHHQLG